MDDGKKTEFMEALGKFIDLFRANVRSKKGDVPRRDKNGKEFFAGRGVAVINGEAMDLWITVYPVSKDEMTVSVSKMPLRQ